MSGFWALGFAFALLVGAAVVAMGWPTMRPYRTPQQEARLTEAIEEECLIGRISDPPQTAHKVHGRCFDSWADGDPSGMCGACFDWLGERAS